MTSVITVVPKEHVGNIWHEVSPWLDKAIARTHGRYHNVDILTSIIERHCVAVAGDSAEDNGEKEILGSLVFVITLYPSGMKLGRIDYIAGHDRDDWFEGDVGRDRRVRQEQWLRGHRDGRPTRHRRIRQGVGRQGIGIFMEYDLGKRTSHMGMVVATRPQPSTSPISPNMPSRTTQSLMAARAAESRGPTSPMAVSASPISRRRPRPV